MINYNGQKVAYIENEDHLYAHVAIVDGDKVEITDSGLLVLRDNYFAYKGDSIAPAKWNFVYENKNPGVDVGVHKNENGKLPELFENVDGEVG